MLTGSRIGIEKFLLPLFCLFLSACSAPLMDAATTLGKQAIIDEINLDLTRGDCQAAIALADPLFNSAYTDNDVRYAYASAHGCNQQINFFQRIYEIIQSPPVGSALWTFQALKYYDTDLTALDKRIESGSRAFQALAAVIAPGQVIIPIDQINTGTYNPGSLFPSDRLVDANVYMVLTSMATMGAIQNRYSAPNATTGNKSQVLGYQASAVSGFAAAVNTPGDGCAFASSLLNMVDAVDEVSVQTNGPGSQALSQITANFKLVLGAVCEAGCMATAAAPIPPDVINFAGTGCAGIPVGTCTGTASRPCPVALRDRSQCTGAANNAASCAAAGIARFVNVHTTLGWP